MLNTILKLIRNSVIVQPMDHETDRRLSTVKHNRMLDIYKAKRNIRAK